MKKIHLILFAALTLTLAAAAARAASVSSFGIRVTIPEGWKCMEGEQVLIYNGSESSAVIIDQVSKNDGESVESVAASLADAVGVKKNDIRRDKTGALSMEFEQNGEPVSVRVVHDRSRVLMVYSFGRDAEARRIARSVGEKAPAAAAPLAQAEAPAASAEKPARAKDKK